MSQNKLHVGRLIDHLHLVVHDLEASYKFYSAIMKVIGIPEAHKGEHYFSFDELFVSDKTMTAMKTVTGRTHLAFQAKDQETVDRAYLAGIEAGGKDNGKPGPRDYHPGYYACFWIDPDGNNIEVVHHGAGKRSAASVEITF